MILNFVTKQQFFVLYLIYSKRMWVSPWKDNCWFFRGMRTEVSSVSVCYICWKSSKKNSLGIFQRKKLCTTFWTRCSILCQETNLLGFTWCLIIVSTWTPTKDTLEDSLFGSAKYKQISIFCWKSHSLRPCALLLNIYSRYYLLDFLTCNFSLLITQL